MESKGEFKEPLLLLPSAELPSYRYEEHGNQTQKRRRRNSRFIALAHLLGLAVIWLHFHGTSCDKGEREDLTESAWGLHTRPGHHTLHSNGGHGGDDDHKGPPRRGKEAIEHFLTVPNNDSAIATSRLVTSKPHIAGSSQDFVTAQNVLELFNKEFKLPSRKDVPVFPTGSLQSRLATFTIPFTSHPRAWIDTYYPLLNMPLDRHLEILDGDGNVEWAAELEEVADSDTDPDAAKYVNAVPTFHGFSKSGDVRGPLIHVGYGTKAEFDALVAKGVNFEGSIVLARYGAIVRGLKIKGAQELGAVGVLIYTDTADDRGVDEEHGFTPYPNGAARNARSVERGSVQFISMYPGDPTTPGRPAYANATRDEALNTPSIPSLPISWLNAKRLLEEIGDDGVGPSKKTIRLHNNVRESVAPIWNTMFVVPGHIKDEIVVVGNHRDAWVLGAVDPSSGTASLHEVVRGFADLWHSGWRPLRTILLASWDAEEYGLIGSTEYGEDFRDFLSKHVVAYINLDSSVSGANFGAAGSPSLSHLLRRVADFVPHPTDPKRSIWSSQTDVGPFAGNISSLQSQTSALQAFEIAAKKLAPASLDVAPLGSGSDFTVFLQHIGIASGEGAFFGAFGDAAYHYHSIFDSERWQEIYGDPGFHRHVAAAQFLGVVTLELADSIILPINTTQYSLHLDSYLDAVEEIAAEARIKSDFTKLRDAIGTLVAGSIKHDTEKDAAEKALRKLLKKQKHKKLAQKLRDVCSHVKSWFVPSPVEADMFVDFAPFNPHAELDWLQSQSAEPSLVEINGLCHAPRGWPSNAAAFPFPPSKWRKFFKAVARVKAANLKLATFERGFISEEGIKEREWYKHLGVAPGKWLGYGATTFPALTEAITIEKNKTLVEFEAGRLTKQILALAEKFRA